MKLVRSLAQKKARREHNLFVVEGVTNVKELLASDFTIENIYGTKDCDIVHERFVTISNKELEQISFLNSPNQVLALVHIPMSQMPLASKTTLVLDNINDPGNLGTIIRTADWFGIDQIICSLSTVDCYNPKVVQATKGSIFHLPIIYIDLEPYLEAYEGTIYAATLDGDENFTIDNEQKLLIMGSESHGLSKELERLVTKKIKIAKKGKAESLNVGIAAGILLHQFTK